MPKDVIFAFVGTGECTLDDHSRGGAYLVFIIAVLAVIALFWGGYWLNKNLRNKLLGRLLSITLFIPAGLLGLYISLGVMFDPCV
jgi:hypothetical protein